MGVTIQLSTPTQDGRALVAAVVIPPFSPLPEVVLWGNRSFRRDVAVLPADATPEYVEVFGYRVP